MRTTRNEERPPAPGSRPRTGQRLLALVLAPLLVLAGWSGSWCRCETVRSCCARGGSRAVGSAGELRGSPASPRHGHRCGSPDECRCSTIDLSAVAAVPHVSALDSSLGAFPLAVAAALPVEVRPAAVLPGLAAGSRGPPGRSRAAPLYLLHLSLRC